MIHLYIIHIHSFASLGTPRSGPGQFRYCFFPPSSLLIDIRRLKDSPKSSALTSTTTTISARFQSIFSNKECLRGVFSPTNETKRLDQATRTSTRTHDDFKDFRNRRRHSAPDVYCIYEHVLKYITNVKQPTSLGDEHVLKHVTNVE